MKRKHYLEDKTWHFETFEKWLRDNGWTEDTSPEAESWNEPAWWHAGKMITRRESWLADDYEDFVYEQKTKV